MLIYGAGGYAGGLVAARAVAAGLEPVLAGRRAEPLERRANELGGLRTVSFDLGDRAATDAALGPEPVLVNCAGPFAGTAGALADACVRTATHYLDIAGEVAEYETVRERGPAAAGAGVMLMPGVGFGIVPTDCVAVRLKRRLPAATRLELAFQTEGEVSRGTATTVLLGIHQAGVERRGGRYVAVRPAARRIEVDFGDGPVRALTNPWRGDQCTAFQSTGIGEIETYIVPPGPLGALMAATRYVGWALGSRPGQALLRAAIGRLPAGPTEEQIERGWSRVWGRVSDAEGNSAEARLHGPDAYLFTALSAVECARRAPAEAQPGFRTPAEVFGPGLVESIEGVSVDDG